MNLQKRICEAFCSEVSVHPFEGGFGVSTPFADSVSGDQLGFYVLNRGGARDFKIVDNALTVERFESEGAGLDSKQRLESFNEILSAYGGSYDEETGELHMSGVWSQDIERKSLDFMAMLLRLQDMYLFTKERVRNTFLEDVANRLHDLNVAGLTVEADQPVSDKLGEVVPDYVLRKDGVSRPVALFVVNGNEKLWQAMHLRMVADYEAKQPLSVVALLETDTTGSQKTRAKASNRLDAMPNWRGDEAAALGRILKEVDVGNDRLH